jgi:hypothetical protein
MAKASGIINIQGTIGGINLYMLNGELIARSDSGGFQSNDLKYGANHVRTRETGNEFVRCSSTGKYLRQSLFEVLPPKEYDGQPQHVVKLMTNLRDCDEISLRGQRNAGMGADTEKGRALLKGFTFNSGVYLDSIFRMPIEVDADGGGMTVGGFDASKGFSFPAGATHCRLRFGVLRFDFGTERRAASYAEPMLIGRDEVVAGFHLGVDAVPVGVGLVLPFLKVEFLQQVGGEMFVFKGKEFGVLEILGVV